MTRTFAMADPLPGGRVALEASAGTGKTWSIVGLAARALAEGHCLAGQLLVVTFARSATRELRSRLLHRLDAAASALDRALAEGVDALLAAHPDDAVVQALCTLDPDRLGGVRDRVVDHAELVARRDRLGDALADIDQATVTTIHGFCAESLDRLGDPGRGELLEDERAFAAEIAADLRLRAVAADPATAGQLPWVDHAVELVRTGLVTDAADVLPAPSLTSYDGARAWFAVQAASEAARRKRRSRIHTHDDLLRRLADRLDDHTHGADVALRVAGHHRLALVDEFQDTDPVQWRILTALFPDPTGTDGRTLVLVGDPKQAIYAFRGADVHAYVGARGAEAQLALDTNRRSDGSVVRAVLALFEDQRMGRGIDVPAVRAAAGDRVTGLGAPVTLVTVPDDAPVRRIEAGALQRTGIRDAVAADVARHVAVILSGDARLTPDGEAPRPVVPADVAVLVRTRHQAVLVQDRLGAAGVPSVLNGVGNVLASPAARDWLHLLRALDRPSQGGLARLAALSGLVGWSTDRVVAAGEDDWDGLHIALHGWRQVLLADGVAAAFRRIQAHTDLAPRLLARPDGDRRLTDLRHIAELLHATHVTGTAGLVAWLEDGMAEAADSSRPVPPEHLASRLERDGDAVQIMTVHGAKGLEFGIVLAPYLWDTVGGNPVVLPFHDHALGHRRVFVAGNRHPDHGHHRDLFIQERDDEERRLAYVAATRARHHLRLWWAPAPNAAESPLGTLLGAGQVHTTAQARAAVAALQQTHPDLFDLLEVDVTAPTPHLAPAVSTGPAPVLAPFDRTIDAGWRRHSYSRLVNDAHAAADEATARADHDSRPATGEEPAEAVPDVPVVGADPSLPDVVPLSGIRGGADVGSALHSVLEHVDFTAEDLRGTVRRQVDRQAERHAVSLGEDPEAAHVIVTDGLVAALQTPLSPGGPALVEVARSARVDELAFELPVLAEGLDDQAGRLLLGDVADLLELHLLPDDPLVGYAVALRHDLGRVEVRGFLAGYIDLLARLPDEDGAYVVADYKTNRLAPAGEPDVTVGHFTPAAMAAEMVRHHYPLQALVYLVAVHRYLRWRIPGYDPDTHLAGVAYLFLRGMVGPATPVREDMVCGVFRWRPPKALLLALDRLFAGGVEGRG